MPQAAPTPCRHPGCGVVMATPGYCDAHRSGQHRDYDRARRGFDTERGFYQSAAWRATRAAFLREHPLCVHCEARGRVVAGWFIAACAFARHRDGDATQASSAQLWQGAILHHLVSLGRAGSARYVRSEARCAR